MQDALPEDTGILQQYDLNEDVNSYMVFASVWENGEEINRIPILSDTLLQDNCKGEFNVSIMHTNEEGNHGISIGTSINIGTTTGTASQSISIPLSAYTMRASTILWDDDKYHDISLETPYPIAAEYIGGEQATGIKAFNCNNLMELDGNTWYSAKQQTKKSDITMILVYYVASTKPLDELDASLDQLLLNTTDVESIREVSDNLERMYEWRTEYIGDNSAVGNITDAWLVDEQLDLVKNGFKLQTTIEPYEVTVHYQSEQSAEDAYGINATLFEQDAALLFSLIENAGVISIDINDQPVATYSRQKLEEKHGDLYPRTETYEGFCELYDEIANTQSTVIVDSNIEETDVIKEIDSEEQFVPSKEEVLSARERVLEGMSAEEIKRLTENIKTANLQMEEAYLYDDIFAKLEDPDSLARNYFDEKGDIQIGWAYDGERKKSEICEEENLTSEEFYQKYGTPVMVYNRFNGENFITLIEDMKSSVHDESLKADLDKLIDETKLATETHEMEHANNIYKILHDMDYYLLRYGIEDVGKYSKDVSLISKYYNTLSVYQ